MNRTLFVDQGSPATGATGKISQPYPTIQAAVDAAAALKPSADDPVTIAILQGNYQEKVFIGIDGLCLRGLGGVTKIKPLTGPAIVVSNATSASVDQYIASNDPHVLVRAGSNSPHYLQLIDLWIETPDPMAYAIYVLGAPTALPLGDDVHAGISLNRCEVFAPQSGKGLNGYFSHQIYLRDGTEVVGATDVFNCGGIWVEDSLLTGLTLTWDPAHDLKVPLGATAFGLVGKNAIVEGTTTLKGVSIFTGQATIDSSFGDLVLQGAYSLPMQGGYIGASLSVDGSATWIAQNVHVQGNLTFATGRVRAQMDGGRYIGTLTDPSKRLYRRIGQ